MNVTIPRCHFLPLPLCFSGSRPSVRLCYCLNRRWPLFFSLLARVGYLCWSAFHRPTRLDCEGYMCMFGFARFSYLPPSSLLLPCLCVAELFDCRHVQSPRLEHGSGMARLSTTHFCRQSRARWTCPSKHHLARGRPVVGCTCSSTDWRGCVILLARCESPLFSGDGPLESPLFVGDKWPVSDRIGCVLGVFSCRPEHCASRQAVLLNHSAKGRESHDPLPRSPACWACERIVPSSVVGKLRGRYTIRPAALS